MVATVVERARKLLEGVGFGSWEYEDWEWELRDQRRYGAALALRYHMAQLEDVLA